MSALAHEAERRWGQTDAWKQSAARAARYTAEDWNTLRAEAAATVNAYADAMEEDCPPDGPQACAAAEFHREHITRWFYDLDHEMHRRLGELYISDPRFTEHYDRVLPGLARYVRDAIHANADRHV